MLSKKFVAAGAEFCTFENHIPAPLFRKTFCVSEGVSSASLTVCGLGFYRVFVNGKDITKGLLAPYISNPDHILYYDQYDISPYLCEGTNVIGFMLGNGMLNCIGGGIWELDKAAYRSAPKVAFALELGYENGKTEVYEADESVKTHSSPIGFDALRCGEIYDAQKELAGWNLPDFEDVSWKSAIPAGTPAGEAMICTAEPIVTIKSLSPVSVEKARISDIRPATISAQWRLIPMDDADKKGYLYDFGENLAGLPRLKIRGAKGQRISVQAGEILDDDGNLNVCGMRFQPEGMGQRYIYTCSGNGVEEYKPSFTYFGMRYCLVSGITEEQATEDLITFEVMSSDLQERGSFSCSDSIVNRLMKACWNADISNFYYFPTDCPHREKNGWTGDVAISAEQLLLWYTAENSLSVWMDNVRKAQRENGALPGIVPTGGWGYESMDGIFYNGPAWDRVIVELPYYVWKLRGETTMIQDNAKAIKTYLTYLSSVRNKQGLVDIGLWDYVPILYKQPMVPIVVSDTLISMDLCKKSELLFEKIGDAAGQEQARLLYEQLRAAARAVLLEADGATVSGHCQSAQALGLAYGLFDAGEKKAAVDVLLKYIEKSEGHLDTGILGERVIFDVLADNGYLDLAYSMITRPDFPSFGHWILEEDCTALFESFKKKSDLNGMPGSKNHHWHGHISGWFFRYLAGIRVNPYDRDVCEVEIAPNFLCRLDHAEGYYEHPKGKIAAAWKRETDHIELTVTIPEDCYGMLRLPEGWVVQERFPYAISTLKEGTTTYLVYPR